MGQTQVTKFYVVINKERWKILTMPLSTYRIIWGRSYAVCDYDHENGKRTIIFNGSRPSRDTIAHELCHAMLSYRDLGRCKPETIEEHVCELMGKKYRILYRLTEKLYKTLHNDV